MTFKVTSLYFILTLALLVSSSHAERLVLVADEWCPYNCNPDSGPQGFMVDIVNEVFAKKGISIEYKTVPWARAIIEVQEGKSHGLIGAGIAEVPNFVFPEIEQGLASHTFYTRSDSQWRYSGLASLDKIRLGVINNYSYGNLYELYIQPNQGSENIIVQNGDGALARNVEMLSLGRIDALVESRMVLQHYLYTSKKTVKVREAGVAFAEKVYIAFSPKLERAHHYAHMLSESMEELRESGRLQEILGRYGITDWQVN